MTEADITRARNASEVSARREEQRRDAWDFLVFGDDEGRHSKHCVHDEPCSRDYNPTPYPDAYPKADMYAGTGIGALYGFAGTDQFLWSLAGWNIINRKEYK